MRYAYKTNTDERPVGSVGAWYLKRTARRLAKAHAHRADALAAADATRAAAEEQSGGARPEAQGERSDRVVLVRGLWFEAIVALVARGESPPRYTNVYVTPARSDSDPRRELVQFWRNTFGGSDEAFWRRLAENPASIVVEPTDLVAMSRRLVKGSAVAAVLVVLVAVGALFGVARYASDVNGEVKEVSATVARTQLLLNQVGESVNTLNASVEKKMTDISASVATVKKTIDEVKGKQEKAHEESNTLTQKVEDLKSGATQWQNQLNDLQKNLNDWRTQIFEWEIGTIKAALARLEKAAEAHKNELKALRNLSDRDGNPGVRNGGMAGGGEQPGSDEPRWTPDGGGREHQ